MQSKLYAEQDEFKILDLKLIDAINIDNCHLVVDYIGFKDEKLLEAIMNDCERYFIFNKLGVEDGRD